MLRCPITNTELKYVGHEQWVMDPDSYYESTYKGRTYKFARHPFSWSLFRLTNIDGKRCKQRYFRLNDDDSWQELMRVNGVDGLIPIDSTNWYIFKQRLARRWKLFKRKLSNFWNYTILRKERVLRSVHAKTVAQDLVSVKPMEKPSTKMMHDLDVIYKTDSEQELVDKTRMPNLSKEDTEFSEHVTGYLKEVTKDNLEQVRKEFKNEKIQIGDEIFAWDMGGWHALAGRAGEIVVRNNTEFITARLTKMS